MTTLVIPQSPHFSQTHCAQLNPLEEIALTSLESLKFLASEEFQLPASPLPQHSPKESSKRRLSDSDTSEDDLSEDSRLSKRRKRKSEPRDRLQALANQLELPNSVVEKAIELQEETKHPNPTLRGRNIDSMMAAFLYIACRQLGEARSIKEFYSKATTYTKKQFLSCFKFMLKYCNLNTKELPTEEFMARLCQALGFRSSQILSQSVSVYQKARELGLTSGRNPISFSSATIFMVSQLSSEKRTLHEIGEASDVSLLTLRSICSLLYEFRKELFPDADPSSVFNC